MRKISFLFLLLFLALVFLFPFFINFLSVSSPVMGISKPFTDFVSLVVDSEKIFKVSEDDTSASFLGLESSFHETVQNQKTKYLSRGDEFSFENNFNFQEYKKDLDMLEYLKIQRETVPNKIATNVFSTSRIKNTSTLSQITSDNKQSVLKKVSRTRLTIKKEIIAENKIKILDRKSVTSSIDDVITTNDLKETKRARIVLPSFVKDVDNKIKNDCEFGVVLCGAGTDENPYQIFSGEQLRDLQFGNLSAVYRLQKDIDLKNLSFEPIGSIDDTFLGVFDGNRYKIENLSLSGDYQNRSIGLFGVIGEGGVVRNLFLDNVEILANALYVGILAGQTHGAFISNVFTAGTIIGDFVAGGVVGKSIYTTLTHVVSFVSLDSTHEKCSGLVAELEYSNILFSSSSGNITCTKFAGGLASVVKHAFIAQSFSSAYLYVALDSVGGLVSLLMDSSVLSDSFFSGTIESEFGLVGGLVATLIESQIKKSYSTGVLFSFADEQEVASLVGNVQNGSQFKNILFVSQENRYDPFTVFSDISSDDCSLNFNYSPLIDDFQLYFCFLGSDSTFASWESSWQIESTSMMLPLLKKTPGIQFVSPTLYVYSISEIPSILLLETLVRSFPGYTPTTKSDIRYSLKDSKYSGFNLSSDGILSIDSTKLFVRSIILTVEVFTPFFRSLQDINILLYE